MRTQTNGSKSLIRYRKLQRNDPKRSKTERRTCASREDSDQTKDI